MCLIRSQQLQTRIGSAAVRCQRTLLTGRWSQILRDWGGGAARGEIEQDKGIQITKLVHKQDSAITT